MTCLFSSSIRCRSFEHAALITLACLYLTLFTVPRSSAQTSQFEQQGDRQLKREPAQPQKQPVEHRVALVIGNGAYQNANRLANPVNDAEDMAAALRGLNFELVGGGAHVNQTADQMKRLIDNYGELLGGGGVGLFYYAGHGIQAQGHNYLIPIEANILNEKTLEYDAVDVDRLLARMDAAGNAFNIVILDACRSNPFSRSWRDASQGLAQVNAPEGTLIAYSTSPGHVANDGKGRNGSYTAELLQQMIRPGLTIEEMFKSVRIRVRAASKNKQTPWESSSLVGDFCFAGSCAGGSAPSPGATRPSLSGDQAAFELSYWESIKSSSDPHDFEAYLQKYPNGQFVELARNNLSRLKVRLNPQPPGSTRDAKVGEILLNVILKHEGGSPAYDADLTAAFLEVLSSVNLDVTDISSMDTKTRTRLLSNIESLRAGFAQTSRYELVIDAELVLNERVASGADGMFMANVTGLFRVFDCAIGRAVITKNLSLRGFGLNPNQAITNAKRNVREGLTEEVLTKIADYAK